MKTDKSVLLEKLRVRLVEVRSSIDQEKLKIGAFLVRAIKDAKNMKADDLMVALNLKAHSEERLKELENLTGSPFFMRCDLSGRGGDGPKTLYFSKHSFPEENIFSWVAPIAAIRFENPGPVSYKLPKGTIEHAKLEKKEQYMIVDGKILFFAIEEIGRPRELVYQEHFSSRKSGFMLPEIVSLMEKAQDAIIRAHHKGSFVISGPAGSGKTTLALHRVAFLIQSPDSAHLYPENSVIVFVQDNGTKDYFSHLLPELGINHVKIATFFEWVAELLDLKDISYEPIFSMASATDGLYEYEKIQALRNMGRISWGKDMFKILSMGYKNLSSDHARIFEEQKKQRVLDRIDLTLLLMAFYRHNGSIQLIREYSAYKNGKYTKKKRKIQLEYSMMIFDEFQNYMPEQLAIMKSCLVKETQSAIFVGDMGQQVYHGTLSSWDEIQEIIPTDRNVRLHKVYRNTRQILEYISKLGYKIEIPEGIKNGPPVVEKKFEKQADLIEYIHAIIPGKQKTLGIICKDQIMVETLRGHFQDNTFIRVSSMREVQGVEFDKVCFVNGDKESTIDVGDRPAEYLKEKAKIEKDLLYVALTRAIEEMHVVSI